MAGSLHGALLSALQDARTEKGPRTLHLTTLRSEPYRTYTLFPHATDQSRRVFKEDMLVLLAEQGSDGTVPVYGLEASLYTVPSTSTCLLYISKIDTTGLLPSPSPSRLLTTAFLAYHLSHPPRGMRKLRIHTFARAAREGQYLFPDSVSNVQGGKGDGAKLAGKRLLDDQQLIRWWKTVLGDAVKHTASGTRESDLRSFYLLPGFDYAESLPLVPPPATLAFPHWVYGHPYTTLSSPVSDSAADGLPLSDLVPAFSDDPQSRFLSSLASSTINPAGEANDWDDYTAEALEATASPLVVAKRKEEMEKMRAREKTRIDRVAVDEFWERMGARQECCDGRVSAFFVVAREGSKDAPMSPARTKPKADTPEPGPGSLPRNVWTKLWSQFHNVDYSSVSKAAQAYAIWTSDVRACVLSAQSQAPSPAPTSETVFEYEVHTVVTVDNPASVKPTSTVVPASATVELAVKRPAEPANVLQVKKKKKVAA